MLRTFVGHSLFSSAVKKSCVFLSHIYPTCVSLSHVYQNVYSCRVFIGPVYFCRRFSVMCTFVAYLWNHMYLCRSLCIFVVTPVVTVPTDRRKAKRPSFFTGFVCSFRRFLFVFDGPSGGRANRPQTEVQRWHEGKLALIHPLPIAN